MRPRGMGLHILVYWHQLPLSRSVWKQTWWDGWTCDPRIICWESGNRHKWEVFTVPPLVFVAQTTNMTTNQQSAGHLTLTCGQSSICFLILPLCPGCWTLTCSLPITLYCSLFTWCVAYDLKLPELKLSKAACYWTTYVLQLWQQLLGNCVGLCTRVVSSVDSWNNLPELN